MIRKKTVCFFLAKFPVLSETFILNQISFLKEDPSLSITVVAIEKGENVSSHKIYKDLSDNIEVITLVDSPDNKIFKLLDRILSIPLAFIKSPKVIGKIFQAPFRNLLLPLLIVKLPALSKFDIIISHFGHVAVQASALKELGCLKGSLYSFFHGNDLSDKNLWKTNYKHYPFLTKGDNVGLPISEFWEKKLLSIGCNSENLHVHRMGVNVSQFSFCPKKEKSSVVRLTSVARLTEKKGLKYAIKALAILNEKGVPFLYQILGDGPDKESLINLTNELGLNEKVLFLGRVGTETVKETLDQTDLFILPSITASSGDMEGVPVALMESMATGILTLSTFHSGIPELIEHNKTGFLVQEKDVEGLATTIQSFFSLDEQKKHEMLIEARKVIEERFNVQLLNEQLKSYL